MTRRPCAVCGRLHGCKDYLCSRCRKHGLRLPRPSRCELPLAEIWAAIVARKSVRLPELREIAGRRNVDNVLLALDAQGYLLSEDQGKIYPFRKVEGMR